MTPSHSQDITQLSEESFARFARFITGELGIKMPASKLSMVQSRLLHRVRELGLDSVEQYGTFLFDSPDAAGERVHLINSITTNKTDFFREAAHFDYLTQTVLPRLTARSGGCHAAVWSAGCSSGEEPYTLAMVLGEFAGRNRGFDYSILATDVSTKVLDRARAGIYEEVQIAPVPPVLRRKYLLRGRRDGRKLVRIIPQVRQKVSFHQLNFMDPDYRIRDVFDVIFFRNVMIYFDRSTQEAVINKMCRNLAPGGHLFAGHSESLAGLNVPVVPVGPSIFRKR